MELIGMAILMLGLALAFMNIRVIVKRSLKELDNPRFKGCNNKDCDCESKDSCNS